VLVYENEPPGESLNKLGGQWEHRSLRRLQRTDSSLTLAAYGGRQLSLEIVFDTRLFRAETITRMLGHLETLLHSFLAQPDAPLSAIRMLTQEEEARLLREWNHTTAPYPRDLCAHQLFEQQVRRTPAGTALEHAGASISYAELNARANRLAWYLRARAPKTWLPFASTARPKPSSLYCPSSRPARRFSRCLPLFPANACNSCWKPRGQGLS
jgi:non-ribosomal peptide synthetase component F